MAKQDLTGKIQKGGLHTPKQDLTIRKKAGRPKKEHKEPTSIQELHAQINGELVDSSKYKRKCISCGMVTDSESKFAFAESNLYLANGHRLPICTNCLNALYNIEEKKFDTYYETYRRICMMFDLYYSDKMADFAYRDSTETTRMSMYCKKIHSPTYFGKTYSNTIVEDGGIILKQPAEEVEVVPEPQPEPVDVENEIEVSQEVKDFWGFGLQNKQYHFLDMKFQEWLRKVETGNDPAYESILRNVCFLELKIQETMADGGDISKLLREYNSLLGSLKLQPKQNDVKEMNDNICFGNLIREWEETEPIPEPSEEFKDVDGIGHYISVWFLGHLCKMMGVKGSYDKVFDEYREEVTKYTVDKPEYDEEDEGAKFKGLFNPIAKEGD